MIWVMCPEDRPLQTRKGTTCVAVLEANRLNSSPPSPIKVMPLTPKKFLGIFYRLSAAVPPLISDVRWQQGSSHQRRSQALRFLNALCFSFSNSL